MPKRQSTATKAVGKAAPTPVNQPVQGRASPVLGRVFDARPDRLDFRDLPYRAPLRSLPPRWPLPGVLAKNLGGYVAQGLILDQGQEGACTGFGLACVANYLLWLRHLSQGDKGTFHAVSARMFYELARRYDEWPGDDYEGSSCRGALKAWHKHGVCSDMLWPYSAGRFVRPAKGWDADALSRPLGVYYRIDCHSIADLQAAITEVGAIYVSAKVHNGWADLARKRAVKPPARHADLPIIQVVSNPGTKGGHAFALVGYDERGFVVQNSWGRNWGASGFAILPYEDWSMNCTDAWACALGVPQRGASGQVQVGASAFRVGAGRSLLSIDRAGSSPFNPPDDPWPFNHEFLNPDYRPLSTEQAYRMTLVTGNDGEIVPTDFTRAVSDRMGLVSEIVVERPLAWAKGLKGPLKLLVYAHGGLNSQDESIQRIRVLAPCFLANGIYPVFLTWKTGPVETLSSMLEDWFARAWGDRSNLATGIWEALSEAKDRAIEATASLLGSGVWRQMRDNARDSTLPGHGLNLLASALVTLVGKREPGGVEIHLVGHSAGSILLGHLLDCLRSEKKQAKVTSCELFAAACSSSFALTHYVGAQQAGVLNMNDLFLDVLSDVNEKNDGLPSPSAALYGKSLLYLVSRALEDVRKQPLLGMERALLPAFANDAEQWNAASLAAIRAWQHQWQMTPGHLNVVSTPWITTTREGHRMQATHGSFDNNITLMAGLIERVAGKSLVSDLEWLDY